MGRARGAGEVLDMIGRAQRAHTGSTPMPGGFHKTQAPLYIHGTQFHIFMQYPLLICPYFPDEAWCEYQKRPEPKAHRVGGTQCD